jgi:hypothetical protein
MTFRDRMITRTMFGSAQLPSMDEYFPLIIIRKAGKPHDFVNPATVLVSDPPKNIKYITPRQVKGVKDSPPLAKK